MRTARSLTISRSICHAHPLATHAPCHTPLPCRIPTTHAPPPHVPSCHACPPAMCAPLPGMSPAMQVPHHAGPTPHMPPAMHKPPSWSPPPAMHTPSSGQNSWHTLLKILPCPNFVAGSKNQSQSQQAVKAYNNLSQFLIWGSEEFHIRASIEVIWKIFVSGKSFEKSSDMIDLFASLPASIQLFT